MYQLRIVPEKALILVTFTGPTNIDDMNALTLSMVEHPDFRKEFNGVCDYRSADVQVTAEEMEDFSKVAVEEDLARGAWYMMVSDPHDTALMTLFKRFLKSQHPVDLYSTVAAVSTKLGQDLSEYYKET